MRSIYRRLCWLSALFASCVPASDTAPARRYEVTPETGMPNLEKSLRVEVIDVVAIHRRQPHHHGGLPICR